MDRVAEAERLVARGDLTPELTGTDRELLASTLQRLRHLISAQNPTEQLLHGEPHPGNIINTANGPVFVDLETCCRGPIEFDLAHAPQTVSALYRGANQVLLSDCRQLVLAMVAVWRWEPGDQLPNGKAFGRALLRVLRVFCGANHGSRSFSSCTASRWTPPASPTFRYSTSSSDRLALGANFMFRGRGFGA